jgi:molecular chaperone DnaK (HSP70)
MPGRVAVDFGTSNTVVAVWDAATEAGRPLRIPGYSRAFVQGADDVPVIPSLIHYAEDSQRWVGDQVLHRNLRRSPATFCWMKRYIAQRSPRTVRVDGRAISHAEAGRDFLSSVLLSAAAEVDLRDEEIVLTVPVESFEHYEDWLAEVAAQAGLPRFRLIDEPSAAARGPGAHVQAHDVYVVFDFGGGTLDVAVVLIEEDATEMAGRRCRVLGKAGADLGGMAIDGLLFEHVLKVNGRQESDDAVRRVSNDLRIQCEAAKERLSFADRAEIGAMDPGTGSVLGCELTRTAFEELLEECEVYARVVQTLRRAMNAAHESGYGEADVKAALMVGGSSLIPSVQRLMRREFGDRVLLERPLDAVARGAAAFAAGVDFYDHVQHDYAIRCLRSDKCGYEYHPLIRRGAPYPTAGPVVTLTVKASYEGQSQLGLAIVEMGEQRRRGSQRPRELVFDPSGAARLVDVALDDDESRSVFWMNEDSPTFLHADPPAQKGGEERFRVDFAIDGNKRLLITVRDVVTGKLTHRDYPVVKLT